MPRPDTNSPRTPPPSGPTAHELMRMLRRREADDSANPKTRDFVLNKLPVLSAIGGSLASWGARKRLGVGGAAALGGGIALAGGLPRTLADMRHTRQIRQQDVFGWPAEPQRSRDARHLALSSLAGLGSSVLGGVGMAHPGRLGNVLNAASLGLGVAALAKPLAQQIETKRRDRELMDSLLKVLPRNG